MFRIDRCPCCDHEAFERWPALVAPFIAAYVLRAPVELCELLQCRGCGFRFFDRRFTPEEIARLYGSYRADSYFEARHRQEPWYSRKYNDDLGHSAEVVEIRQEHLLSFVRRFVELGQVKAVLDYGGDKGQLLPATLGQTRHVFEVSDVVPVAGVTRLGSEQELVQSRYDLVILCQVLEHHSTPAELVRKMAKLVHPGGLVYIKVPHERVRMGLVPHGAGYRWFLDRLRRFPFLTRVLDLWSTAARVKFGFIPPLGFAKLHEHLNFFDESSLRALVGRCGLQVLTCERSTWARGPLHPQFVTCVAQRPVIEEPTAALQRSNSGCDTRAGVGV